VRIAEAIKREIDNGRMPGAVVVLARRGRTCTACTSGARRRDQRGRWTFVYYRSECPRKLQFTMSRRKRRPNVSGIRLRGGACRATGISWTHGDVEGEAPITQRNDDQPTAGQRRVGLIMAASAECNQAVEVEVGAAAGALEDMVNVEATAATARLATPAGAAAHLAPNRLPLDARGGRRPPVGAAFGGRVGIRSGGVGVDVALPASCDFAHMGKSRCWLV